MNIRALPGLLVTVTALAGVLLAPNLASAAPSPAVSYTRGYAGDADNDVQPVHYGTLAYSSDAGKRARAETEIYDFSITHTNGDDYIYAVWNMATVPDRTEAGTVNLYRATAIMGDTKLDFRAGRDENKFSTVLYSNGALTACPGLQAAFKPQEHTVNVYLPVSCLPKVRKMKKINATTQGFVAMNNGPYQVAKDVTDETTSLVIK